MTSTPSRRRVLIVVCPAGWAGLAPAAREAGWDVAEADDFSHGRFLLSMTAFDAVVAGETAGAEFLAGVGWLAERVAAPPLLVARSPHQTILDAVRHGALWLSPEAVGGCPALLGALLEQADVLGRRRRDAERDRAALGESEARAERLLAMLWESARPGAQRWLTQRHVLERIDEEVERTRRGGAPFAVVLGELTPPPGQALPREEADRLAGWMATQVVRGKRRCDVAGHYGPHGFLLVLPQTTAAQAQATCRRLGQLLAHPPHAGPGEVRPRFALVLGDGPKATVPGLLRRAEERLELARERGAGVVGE